LQISDVLMLLLSLSYWAPCSILCKPRQEILFCIAEMLLQFPILLGTLKQWFDMHFKRQIKACLWQNKVKSRSLKLMHSYCDLHFQLIILFTVTVSIYLTIFRVEGGNESAAMKDSIRSSQ
jgi:hypothetical protein